MAGLLRDRPASAAQRARNAARHQPRVVAAVLAMLLLYAYLFTHAAGYFGLPLPEELARLVGWLPQGVFDADHNVDSEIWIYRATAELSDDDQRLVLFAAAAGAFLCAYFLPPRYKQASLVLWFLAAGLALYGTAAMAGLLAAHLAIYLLFHTAPPRQGMALSAAAGLLGYLAFAGMDWAALAPALLAGATVMELYRHGLPRLERHPRLLAGTRLLAIQSALASVVAGALAQGLSGNEWSLPLGVLLFFWQWERLMLYHLDYQHQRVPNDLPLSGYLSVFLSPAVLPNWHWGVAIGQGYAYLDRGYLADDKNKLALDGVKIWGAALVYLVFGGWIKLGLVALFTGWGLDVHNAQTKALVCAFVADGRADTASVLATTLLDQTRWLLTWAAALHFKTGLWRVFGYRMDPYFNRPWLATNLVELWTRFTFHYREFLVRVFYYPVFFRWFQGYTVLRVLAATLAAASLGNLFWGHLPEEMFYKGLRFGNFWGILQTWPYFVLLGLGITLTELYLMRRKTTRKPWTLDRQFPLDILAAYLTLQFYSLIHVFARPCAGGTLDDYTRLFLIGLGIPL